MKFYLKRHQNKLDDTPKYNPMKHAEHFDGFEYAAETLKKYLHTAGIFTIMLQDEYIVTHHPSDAAAFREWLTKHDIQDIDKPRKP